MNTRPSAAMSPSATPVMPENRIEAAMSTCASPPRIQPKKTLATWTSRSVILPSLTSSPARMNSGIAIRTKTSIP